MYHPMAVLNALGYLPSSECVNRAVKVNCKNKGYKKGEFGTIKRMNTFILGVEKPYMLWDPLTPSEVESYLRIQGPMIVKI